MTFSRHYAKARKAALKQQKQQAGQTLTPPCRQAERIQVPNPPSVQERAVVLWRFFVRSLVLFVCLLVAVITWYERAELVVPVRHINVEGQAERTNQQALQKVLSSVVAQSMFANLQPLQRQLSSLPWVKTVQIKRKWPNTLVISFSEVKPIARFNDKWVFTQDDQLYPLPNDSTDLGLQSLPWLVGPMDSARLLWQAYQAMTPVLAPLGLRIWQLRLSPRFSYEIVLNNGLILYLGTSQVMERLQLFSKVYAQQLAPKVNQMTHVDLRYASSMAIGWKTPTAIANSPNDGHK